MKIPEVQVAVCFSGIFIFLTFSYAFLYYRIREENYEENYKKREDKKRKRCYSRRKSENGGRKNGNDKVKRKNQNKQGG